MSAHRPRASRSARALRVRIGSIDVAKIGATKIDWRDPYHVAIGLSWPWFIAAVLGTHFSLNVLFGLLYVIAPGSIINARPHSFADAFFFSVETLATVGYGVMAPQTLYGHAVAAVEIVVGMGFAAVTTGLLFVRFSRPRHRIVYSSRAVIARRNGRPTLMVRLANARSGSLINASAHLTALITEHTQEGQLYRLPQELRLERARIPIFALTWTLMHTIDEASPLHGYDEHRLEEEGVRLFLSIEAHDPVLASEIRDVRVYSYEDIAFNTRFADVISMDAAGRTVVDIRRIDLVERDEEGPAEMPEWEASATERTPS